MLHVFKLDWNDDAVMMPAIARQYANQFIRLRVDDGDPAGQALEAAEWAQHVLAVVRDGGRLQVGTNSLNFLLDLPCGRINYHHAARRRRWMKDRQIQLGAVQREDHVERVRVLASPQRIL